jgi:hypothetical protein
MRPPMTNAHTARLVRVTTRALGGAVPSETPLSAGNGNQFEVAVEGLAGRLLSTTGQPYSLEIVAFDVTAGGNPHSERNNFTQRRLEQFDGVDGWPNKLAVFTVTLNDLAAVQGHLLRYHAVLLSANQIESFVESPLFLLHADRHGTRAPGDALVGAVERTPFQARWGQP